MRIAVFGGSFDPVHNEHVELVKSAINALALDKVLVMPSFFAPHKHGGAHVGSAERFEMCQIAFRNISEVEVSNYELTQAGTSYTYLTCRWFAEKYPNVERFFLVGADMLENFFFWRNPDDILQNVALAACGRGELLPKEFHERFHKRFGCDYTEVPFTGKEVSSTDLRVALAFPNVKIHDLDKEVLSYIEERKLYQYPEQVQALELEKPERRAHSYRVARMACERAKGLGIPEEKALLASMLHDCGKYIPCKSPVLAGMELPDGVPSPVIHQYSGAYLAEHFFGIKDEDILNAIRYHTSGRVDMSMLEKLIFLADLLEEERCYPGVEELRKLFWEDLDVCLERSLREQIQYLKSTGNVIYSLTKDAYLWISKQ